MRSACEVGPQPIPLAVERDRHGLHLREVAHEVGPGNVDTAGLEPPQWQSRAGLGNTRGRFSMNSDRIQSTDVVLPLAEDAHRTLRIRCVVRPDKAQALLLDRLGLRLPERLKVPTSIHRM